MANRYLPRLRSFTLATFCAMLVPLLTASDDTLIPVDPRAGLRGTALVGPVRPHDRLGRRNLAPLPGAVIVVYSGDSTTELTRITADGDGKFLAPLLPGTYRLVPLAPNPDALFPRAGARTVRIPSNHFRRVVFLYESGIR